MAVTKKAKSGKKAVAKKAGKAAAKSSAAKTTKSKPAAKKSTPKKAASTGASKKATSTTAAKKSTSLKLNERQREYLQKVKAAGETGYEVGPSYEQRTIDALIERKLVKRGAKDKSSGKHRYALTKAGEKQLTGAPSPAASAAP
jgi:DNA-binding protein HU-beta